MYVSLSSQVSEGHRQDLLAEAGRLHAVRQAHREPKAIRQHRVTNRTASTLRKGLALAVSLAHGLTG